MVDIEKNEKMSENKKEFSKRNLLVALTDFLGLLFFIMVLFLPIFKCSPNFIDTRDKFSLINESILTWDNPVNRFKGTNFSLANFINIFIIAAIVFIISYIIKCIKDIKMLRGKVNKSSLKKSSKTKKKKTFKSTYNMYGFLVALIVYIVVVSLVRVAKGVSFSYMPMVSGISVWGVLTVLVLVGNTVTKILKTREEMKHIDSNGETPAEILPDNN